MSEHRLDLSPLGKVEKMADGRLIADAHITRTGILTYMNPDGTLRRELRDDPDVFDAASMRSARMMPITNRHPTVGLVTPANAKKYMVGSTGERVDRDEDHLRTKVMVNDEESHLDLAGGINQVSCGYKCDVVKKPGVHPKYGRYDVKQVNIRYNHLAIVPTARAGETARIRMDADDAEVVPDLWTRVDEGTEMAKKKIPAFIKKKIAASKKPDDDDDKDEEDDDDEDDRNDSWLTKYNQLASVGISMMDSGESVRLDAKKPDDDDDDDGDDEDSSDEEEDEEDDEKDEEEKTVGPFVKKKRTDHLDLYRRAAAGKKVPKATHSGKPGKDSGRRRADSVPVAGEDRQMAKDPKKELETALSELGSQKLRADEAEKALTAEKERADAAVGEVKGLQRTITELERERADASTVDVAAKDEKIVELTERIDAAEQVISEFPARLALGVKARVDLEKAAIGVMGAEFNCDGMTDREIMASVVAKRGGAVSNESDAELRGEFRAAIRGDAAWKKSAREIARVSGHKDNQTEHREDASQVNPHAKTRDAWKQPLPSMKKGA